MKKMVVGAAISGLALVFEAVSQTPAGPKRDVVFQLTEAQDTAWDS